MHNQGNSVDEESKGFVSFSQGFNEMVEKPTKKRVSVGGIQEDNKLQSKRSLTHQT
jgi:hypothetical protein